MAAGAAAQSVSAGLTRAVALGGASVALLAQGLGAQTLRGTIVDRETGAPVVGAIVSLVADSTRRWPVLTDGTGAFRLRADSGGTYRVRVDRVGFQPFVQELPVTLVAGALVDRTIRVPASRAELATVKVTTAAACNAPGIRGADAARVWEQLRTALDGTRLTAQRSLAPLEMVLEESMARGPAGAELGVREFRKPTQVWRTRSARTFVTPEGIDVRTRGFRLVAGDSADYVGPDAEVALSEGFLATHCFRVVRSRGLLGKRRLGLAFAPLDTVRATFLRGTMWLEESTSQLDAVEYTYSVPFWPRRVAVPRGVIRFAALPGGGWIVREWELWLPVLDTPTLTAQPATPIRHAATLVKRGRARVLGKDTNVPMPTAYLLGAVYDSVAGEPLAGATVRVQGREVAVLDAAGAFALRVDSLSGEGATMPVQVLHPLLARYGVPVLEQVVSVRPGDSLQLSFAFPGTDSVLARACPGLASPRPDVAWGTTSLGAMFVEIQRAPSDTSRLHARVEWEWEDKEEPKVTWSDDAVDAAGTVVLCPVATDLPVTLIVTDASGTRLRWVILPVGRRSRRLAVELPPLSTAPMAPPAPPSGNAAGRW